MRHPAAATPTITIYSTALQLMRLLMLLIILIAVAPSFAQTQRQVYAYAQSNIFRRISTSTTALALLLVPIANSGQILVNAQPPQFQSVGDGACQDCSGGGSGGEYDKISFQHGTNGVTVTSVDDCVRLCTACAVEVSSGNPNRVFRGFTYVDQYNPQRCACYFDDAVDFTTECQNIIATCASTGESPFVYTSERTGTGEICTSSGNTLSECFKLTAPFVASDHAPTGCPSMVPSISSMPSETVSLPPSEVPSTSIMPSISPSLTPSEVPSTSILPSPSPSSAPSEAPSLSVVPSTSPSSTPSEVPSTSPSSNPSSIPSSEPSTNPSCAPSAYPTESPSAEFDGPALWYPKWQQGAEGCFIDGQEPRYMTVNPGEWLSTTLQKCCKKYFSGYYYEQCLGRYPPTAGNCMPLLFYPDWHGSNERCLDDGEEPLYMLQNKEFFLSNSLLECCEKFYNWDIYGCLGTLPTLTNGNFYPDWEGRSHTCLNSSDDNVVPDYMLMNQKYYLSTTLEKCCEKHFFWKINKCLGSSPDSSISGTNKWYVNWVDSACVQDCQGQGSLQCGGIADAWDKLYDSKEECCEKRLFWIGERECLSK